MYTLIFDVFLFITCYCYVMSKMTDANLLSLTTHNLCFRAFTGSLTCPGSNAGSRCFFVRLLWSLCPTESSALNSGPKPNQVRGSDQQGLQMICFDSIEVLHGCKMHPSVYTSKHPTCYIILLSGTGTRARSVVLKLLIQWMCIASIRCLPQRETMAVGIESVAELPRCAGHKP